MKKLGILFGLLCLFHAGLTQSEQTLIIEPDIKAQPGNLKFDHSRGSITVNGYDGHIIFVSAPENAAIQAIQKNNRVTILSNATDGAVPVEIRVPRNWSVDITNRLEGDVIINSLSGDMVVENNGGAVYLNNISGVAMISTLDGMIRGRFSAVPRGQPMAFSTMDGSIDMSFPKDTDAVFRLRTEHGQVVSDFELDKKESKTSRSANLQYRWIFANRDRGGTQITLSTYNGDIFIRHSQ